MNHFINHSRTAHAPNMDHTSQRHLGGATGAKMPVGKEELSSVEWRVVYIIYKYEIIGEWILFKRMIGIPLPPPLPPSSDQLSLDHTGSIQYHFPSPNQS